MLISVASLRAILSGGSSSAATPLVRPQIVPAAAGLVAPVAAVGRITLTGQPANNDTFRIHGVTFTWKDSGAAGELQIDKGGSAELSIDAAIVAINDHSTLGALATALKISTDKIQVTWDTKGVVGNAIVFTESMANATINGSGFLGGTTAGVDGTVGGEGELRVFEGDLYFSPTASTTAASNWVTIPLEDVGGVILDADLPVTMADKTLTGATITTTSLEVGAGGSALAKIIRGTLTVLDGQTVIVGTGITGITTAFDVLACVKTQGATPCAVFDAKATGVGEITITVSGDPGVGGAVITYWAFLPV